MKKPYSGLLRTIASTSIGLSLLLIAPALASAATPTFAPQVQYTTDPGAENVVTGDFNGDGKSDFATNNDYAGTVNVFLGNGDGTFQPRTTYADGPFPHSIAVGDFNGDGKLDLVTDEATNAIAILLGHGDGTFGPVVHQSVTYVTGHVAVSDLNGDGKLDLVETSNSNFGPLLLLIQFGYGNGTFQPQVSQSVLSPGTATFGDLNGDNQTDMIVANGGFDSVSVLLNTGGGTFAPEVIYAVPVAPGGGVITDINGDGKADAVLIAQGVSNGNVSVLLGNGDGTLNPAVAYSAALSPAVLVSSDFNGDGKVDVAVADYPGDAVSVLAGNGDGTFGPAVTLASGVHPIGLATADFNADGKSDLVSANVDGGTASVFLNTTPSTVAYYRFETGPNGAALASIVDSSGNGNNGAVLTGAPTYNSSIPITPIPQTGAPNTFSGNFGDSDAASFAYPFPFNTNTNATLEFWIKPTSGTDSGDFLWGTTSGGDTNRFHLSWGVNDEVCGDYREPGGPAHAIGCTGVGTVPDGQWSFVAIVKQGNTYKMYVNNAGTSNTTVLKNTLTDVSPNLPNSTGWTINGRCVTEPNCGPGSQLSGLLDEVRLSNQALTPSQFLMLDQPTGVVTALAPAKVWVGLKNSDDVGTKFDLKAEAYNGATLIGSGTLNSFNGGSSGFNNAHLASIPLSAVGSPTLPSGSTLNFKLYVRNACVGPTHNSGTARLWYDGADANSQFGLSVDNVSSTNYLRNAFALASTAGTSKKSIDVAAGAPCSAYKLFGTWSRITP